MLPTDEHQDAVDRITKLLRLARDQEGTPQGSTARKIAEKLMRRHGIEVELEDREEEEAKLALLSVDPLPVEWKEYLGHALTVIYRCEYASRWTGAAWNLHAYANEADRVATCLDHFRFIHDQVAAKARSLERMLARGRIKTEQERENIVASYAEGLIYAVAESLIRKVGWLGQLPFVEGPFDLEKFNAVTLDPLAVDEPEDTGEPGLRRFRYSAPADPPFPDDGNVQPPPMRSMDPELGWFDRGVHDSRYLSAIPTRLLDAFRPPKSR